MKLFSFIPKTFSFLRYHFYNFYPIRLLRAYIRLNRAIDSADKAHASTGERYYVLPMIGGGLIVTDRYNFRKNKINGRIFTSGKVSQNPTIRDVENESFYHTPYFIGTGSLTPSQAKKKRIQYYRWANCSLKIFSYRLF